jgi:hypothetical protein
MVDAGNIHTHIVSVPEDRLYAVNCRFKLGCINGSSADLVDD